MKRRQFLAAAAALVSVTVACAASSACEPEGSAAFSPRSDATAHSPLEFVYEGNSKYFCIFRPTRDGWWHSALVVTAPVEDQVGNVVKIRPKGSILFIGEHDSEIAWLPYGSIEFDIHLGSYEERNRVTALQIEDDASTLLLPSINQLLGDCSSSVATLSLGG